MKKGGTKRYRLDFRGFSDLKDRVVEELQTSPSRGRLWLCLAARASSPG
jgi:hypothetical protein